jgi:Holliday junction DNA helicase RuvB
MDFLDILGITQLMEWGKDKLGIVSKEEPYHSEQIKPKTYSFRPQNLEQYIGQFRAKELININLQKIREIKPVHFIISGSKGTGKSTLAYIIANELDYEISTYVAGSFTQENLVQFLVKNADAKKMQILFVDEIHGLDKSLGEFMYPLLEDFLLPVGNLKVKPFIFIGATTDKNILQKRLAPMIDRCQSVNLEHYSAEDIKAILKQYNDQIYQLNISEDIYDTLSMNCRYTPRLSINLMDDFIITNNVTKVLSAHQIIKNSLTTNDIIVLKHLAEINKPVGVEVMSIITQQTKSDFMVLQEPFLIFENYIARTSRGRCITEKGKELLRSLDEK